MMSQATYRVSALISLYRAERFIEGRLFDLFEQSLYKRGELQIVIVNSGSPESEDRFVRDAKARSPHIEYIRTGNRETLYAAWNRCIDMAQSPLLTNANADDRLREDALEILADALDADASIGYAYGDALLSTRENERFDEVVDRSVYRSQDYFGPDLLLHQFIGHQPMWRRDLHDRVGRFDESMTAAGDYEFMVRCASVARGKHVGDAIGTLLKRSDSITFRDGSMNVEVNALKKRFRTSEKALELYRMEGIDLGKEGAIEACLLHLGNRALLYFSQWGGGRPDADFEFAKQCYDWVLKSDTSGAINQRIKDWARQNREAACELAGEGCESINNRTRLVDPDLEAPTAWVGIQDPMYAYQVDERSSEFGMGCRILEFDLLAYWESLSGFSINGALKSDSMRGEISVWGACKRGELIARFLRIHGVEVARFIDSDASKSGKELSGIPIVAPDSLPKDQSGQRIISGVSDQQAPLLREQLSQLGWIDQLI